MATEGTYPCIQGLVLETSTLRNQEGTAAAARTQGLQVMTYGT